MIEGFMVRHKPSGMFLKEGMRVMGKRGGKVWRDAAAFNSAMRWHTKDVSSPRCPDFIRNPKDYEVIVLREVDHMELTQWFEWR